MHIDTGIVEVFVFMSCVLKSILLDHFIIYETVTLSQIRSYRSNISRL